MINKITKKRRKVCRKNKSWDYTSDGTTTKIVNKKGDVVFKEDSKSLLKGQIEKLGISVDEFNAIKDKQKYVDLHEKKFFVKETPEMTIIFSEINYLREEIIFDISFILIK